MLAALSPLRDRSNDAALSPVGNGTPKTKSRLGGGVIPPQDFDELRGAGVAAIFPPGTVIAEAAMGLLDKLNQDLGYV